MGRGSAGRASIVPTGVERSFGADELIVTKTDLRSHLTYANDVFLRVSAYEESEVLGRPHNVIRHPDMPRCLFALLWDTLKARQEMFAYVVNLAGDGAHYWVFAHVTPSTDRAGSPVGYHSNRRVPDRGALEEIRPLYQRLVATERAHARPADAIAASSRQLQEHLDARGATYDEYVWSLAGTAARA